MNQDRWHRIEHLVEQALELPPEEQTAFIQKVCGDDEELRKEITSLLQYKEQAFSFIREFSENVVPPAFAEQSESTEGEDQRINTVVGHYQIIDILGRGGMGVVYKAMDTKLDRTVALKFLPSHLTRSKKDRQRFIREAKAAAALNHPNICIVHAVEEHEGQHFISMEFIDGQTLEELLETRELNSEATLEFASKFLDALAEAHEKGVVHRDIKPGNIMIDNKNRVKVMDFGLAKLRDASNLTREGTTMGTVQYMSPEQAIGKEIDHRTDIWSIGVVLYEMLAGKKPFGGVYDQAVIYSILNENPEPLNSLHADIPNALNKIVLKCLEKDPNDRYQTVKELAGDLNRFHTKVSGYSKENQPVGEISKKRVTQPGVTEKFSSNAPSLQSVKMIAGFALGIMILLFAGYLLLPLSESEISENTIAVLPLESISQNEDDIQFTNEMHVELVNRLAGIGELTVIARSSVLGYEPGERDFRKIGEELGVSTLMEGTVRRFEDQLMVSLELIDADNQGTIWSGSFEENVSDIFEIQSRIARQVANELHASLTEEEQQRLNERPTDNQQAYRLYLQGREFLSRSLIVEENLKTAQHFFNRAVEEDPSFAQAWAMQTYTYCWLYWFNKSNQEYLVRLRETAEEAQRLDPDLSETQLAVGLDQFWSSSDHEQTLFLFETALQQFPNEPLLHFFTALTHRRLGNWELLIEHLNKALELDPLKTNIYTELSFDYWLMRDYIKAESYLDQVTELKPDQEKQYNLYTYVGLSKDGTLDSYEQVWEEIYPLDPAVEEPLIWGRYNYLKRNWEEAIRGYEHLGETAANDEARYILRDYLIGVAYDRQGSRTEALKYYESAKQHLEKLVEEFPNEARYRSALGRVYARLGENENAIIEGEKAVELIPTSQNANQGPLYEWFLAEIYAWTGHEDQAIDKLEYLLSIPSRVHRNDLRLEPIWDPLRNHPLFQELIAGEDEPYLEGL